MSEPPLTLTKVLMSALRATNALFWIGRPGVQGGDALPSKDFLLSCLPTHIIDLHVRPSHHGSKPTTNGKLSAPMPSVIPVSQGSYQGFPRVSMAVMVGATHPTCASLIPLTVTPPLLT